MKKEVSKININDFLKKLNSFDNFSSFKGSTNYNDKDEIYTVLDYIRRKLGNRHVFPEEDETHKKYQDFISQLKLDEKINIVQKIDEIFEKFDTNSSCPGRETNKSVKKSIKSYGDEVYGIGDNFFNDVEISFNLIDVRGDGRCFFYALLQEIRDKFKDKNEKDISVEQNFAMKDTRMLEIYLLKNFIDPESKQNIKKPLIETDSTIVKNFKDAILKTPITTHGYVASDVYPGICNLFKNDFNIRILHNEDLFILCQNDDDTKSTVYLFHDGNHYQRMNDVQFKKDNIIFRTENEYNNEILNQSKYRNNNLNPTLVDSIQAIHLKAEKKAQEAEAKAQEAEETAQEAEEIAQQEAAREAVDAAKKKADVLGEEAKIAREKADVLGEEAKIAREAAEAAKAAKEKADEALKTFQTAADEAKKAAADEAKKAAAEDADKAAGAGGSLSSTSKKTTLREDTPQYNKYNISKLSGLYTREEEKEEGITPMQAGAIITSIAAISIGVFMTVG